MVVVSAPVTNRKELDRWRDRSRSRKRFLLLSFLIGAIAWGTFSVAIGIISQRQQNGGVLSIEVVAVGVGVGLLTGLCFGGPLAYIACYLLYTVGSSNYANAMAYLRKENRVCDVCETAALFNDKYLNPSPRKKHTVADLVPHMNVVEEGGRVNVLCDACYAEVTRDQ